MYSIFIQLINQFISLFILKKVLIAFILNYN